MERLPYAWFMAVERRCTEYLQYTTYDRRYRLKRFLQNKLSHSTEL
jgi:hypothetical protein